MLSLEKDYENIKIFENLNIGNIYKRPENYKYNTATYTWKLLYNNLDIFLTYIQKYPLKGKKKKHRINLLYDYQKLKKNKAHLAKSDSPLFLEWKNFCYNWYQCNPNDIENSSEISNIKEKYKE